MCGKRSPTLPVLKNGHPSISFVRHSTSVYRSAKGVASCWKFFWLDFSLFLGESDGWKYLHIITFFRCRACSELVTGKVNPPIRFNSQSDENVHIPSNNLKWQNLRVWLVKVEANFFNSDFDVDNAEASKRTEDEKQERKNKLRAISRQRQEHCQASSQ